MPSMSRATSHAAERSSGASKLTATPTASERRTGTSGSRRSDSRPASGTGPPRWPPRPERSRQSRSPRPPAGSAAAARAHPHPEAQPGKHGQPHSGADLAVPDRGPRFPQPLRLGPVRARNDERHRHQYAPSTAAPLKAGPVPARAAMVPTTGPNSARLRRRRTRRRGAHRAVPRGRPGQQPGRPPTCTRRPSPARNARCPAPPEPTTSRRSVWPRSSAPARAGPRPVAQPRGEHPARQGADQGAEG